jgi:hypothetical protein
VQNGSGLINLRGDMTKTAKVLLVLGILFLVVGGAFNLGWLGAGDLDALYAIFPVGAVFLGLFLIELVLEKERALHDQEHRPPDIAREGRSQPASPSSSTKPAASSPGASSKH